MKLNHGEHYADCGSDVGFLEDIVIHVAFALDDAICFYVCVAFILVVGFVALIPRTHFNMKWPMHLMQVLDFIARFDAMHCQTVVCAMGVADAFCL